MENTNIKSFITKKEFCTIIENIKKQMEIDDKFQDATKAIDVLEQGFYYNYELVLGSLIDLLEIALSGEKYKQDEWVSWWIYETDFGRHTNIVTTQDDKDYKLKTPEDLWDFVHDDYDNLEESDEKPDNNIRKTTEANLSDILKQDCNK